MNYTQNYDLFFPFFIKVVVNKSKAYSFLIVGIMHVQKILLSVIMLRFYFFTAKQGTWVHNFDRGPYCNQQSQPCRFIVCQGILFFLLKLTRNLTVNSDDDSAMTYVILGTHLCHATVHLLVRRSKVKVTRRHTMKMHSQQKMWSMLESPDDTTWIKL